MPEQFTLFDDEKAGPKGLRHADNFVSLDVEMALISEITALPLTPFQFGQYEGKRRVASFGYSYDYIVTCCACQFACRSLADDRTGNEHPRECV